MKKMIIGKIVNTFGIRGELKVVSLKNALRRDRR